MEHKQDLFGTDVSPVPTSLPAQDNPKAHHSKIDPRLNFKRLGRQLAMQYLFECDLRNSICEQNTMEDFWEQADRSGKFPDARTFRKARIFAEQLIAHVQTNDDLLVRYLDRFSEKWDVNRMSAVDRNIMKVAVAEMLYWDSIPNLVSIDEAIEISKDFSDAGSGVFINGILNGIKNEIEKNPPVKTKA